MKIPANCTAAQLKYVLKSQNNTSCRLSLIEFSCMSRMSDLPDWPGPPGAVVGFALRWRNFYLIAVWFFDIWFLSSIYHFTYICNISIIHWFVNQPFAENIIPVINEILALAMYNFFVFSIIKMLSNFRITSFSLHRSDKNFGKLFNGGYIFYLENG